MYLIEKGKSFLEFFVIGKFNFSLIFIESELENVLFLKEIIIRSIGPANYSYDFVTD